MFSQSLLANSPHLDQQLFFTGNASWQIWRKPEGKCFAYMLCIGGAAGGAGGQVGGANGGGGGGSGAISRLFIPIWMLPDTLYVQVGAGGTGGASNSTGTAGARSFISLQPNSTAANCYLASGHVAATGGQVTTAGGGETIATAADCILVSNGNSTFIAGVAGAKSAAIIALASIPVTGGAAGGDGSQVGYNVTGAGLIPTITGGSTSSALGGPGITGIILFGSGSMGFMSCGGSGGGAANGSGGVGGSGGNGGLGSGGGGGGNGISGTGGNGGKGGDGFVGIWSV